MGMSTPSRLPIPSSHPISPSCLPILSPHPVSPFPLPTPSPHPINPSCLPICLPILSPYPISPPCLPTPSPHPIVRFPKRMRLSLPGGVLSYEAKSLLRSRQNVYPRSAASEVSSVPGEFLPSSLVTRRSRDDDASSSALSPGVVTGGAVPSHLVRPPPQRGRWGHSGRGWDSATFDRAGRHCGR